MVPLGPPQLLQHDADRDGKFSLSEFQHFAQHVSVVVVLALHPYGQSQGL